MINLFPKLSINNKNALQQSKIAGCYCCCKVFEAKDVKNYTDNNNTGLCPLCGCDCLVCDNLEIEIDESILKKANKFWIGE